MRAHAASILASGVADHLAPAVVCAADAADILLKVLSTADPERAEVADALCKLALGIEDDGEQRLALAESIGLIALLRDRVAPVLTQLMQHAGGLVGIGAFRQEATDPAVVSHLT